MMETKLSDAQAFALSKLKSNGDWMLLRDIQAQWRTVNALVDKGLVERHTVASLSEYKAT
jgi:hypothetical protein